MHESVVTRLNNKSSVDNKSVSLGLAPMEGVTELATRLWFTQTSPPDFATTPFLRITRGYPYKRVPATFCPEMSVLRSLVPFPVAPQLMGSCPEDLCRVGEQFLKETPFIDINCGCPAPTVVGNGAGSALLFDSNIFKSFFGEMSTQLGSRQISIKMRTGFSDSSQFESFLEILAQRLPRRVTVHGRTRADRYLGLADWNLIQLACEKLQNIQPSASLCEVVGSGDVTSLESFKSRLQAAPKIQSIIIGRGALRNPWIFEELRTGEKVQLSFCVLKISLACFALLQELCDQSPSKVFALAQSGVFLKSAGTDLDRWHFLYELLHDKYFGVLAPKVSISCLEISRGSFCKLKMLWNSLRSSLPGAFFAPPPLRAPGLPQFFAALNSAAALCSKTLGGDVSKNLFCLNYDSQWDWVYSGASKGDKSDQSYQR